MDLFNFLFEPEIALEPWMESGDFTFTLVTLGNIQECIDSCINARDGRFALDLETTGVDNRVFAQNGVYETKDKIVGVCLSPDGRQGWYIPLRHEEGAEHNIPWTIFEVQFRRLIDAVMRGEVVAVFHHGKFDQEFLEFPGVEPFGDWSAPKKWEDTLILAYLRNSRARRKGLKDLSAAPPDADHTHACGGPGLGMKMLELSSLFPDNHPRNSYNFALLNPSHRGPLIYGCSDAICTRLLCDVLLPAVLTPAHRYSQNQIYRIEKSCVAATRWMERNRIPTSREKVMELVQLGQQEWLDSVLEVYRSASEILGRDVMPGYYKVLQEDWVADDPANLLKDQLMVAKQRESLRYPNPLGTVQGPSGKPRPWVYDVNAPKQLGEMFEEMGVPGLKYTEKSKQIQTSKAELDRVIKEAESRFPFMSKIKRFREVSKALSSYLFPMLEDADPGDHTIRINFNAHKTDTGRFSTPAQDGDLASDRTKRIQGWPDLNFQSIPATYDPRRPASMNRIRECVKARPGRLIIAVDFSGEELRLVTNYSLEAKWLQEFFRCSGCGRNFSRGNGETVPAPPPRCPNCGSDKIGDLHTLTALEIYGKDAVNRPEWKQLRGNSKCVHPETLIIKNGLPMQMGDLTFGQVDEFQHLPAGSTTQGCTGPISLLESYNGGVKPLFHVVTRRGIVTCSDQHRFQIQDGTLKSISTGLQPGDVIQEAAVPELHDTSYSVIPIQLHKDVPVLSYTPTHEMSYFAGAYLGDGCKDGDRSVSIAHGTVRKCDRLGIPYVEWQQILVNACEQVGLRPVSRDSSIYLGSRNTIRFFEALSLVSEHGHRKLRVPPWIMAAGKVACLHYLAGLWDTDGYVNAKDGGGNWTTKDIIFAAQVCALISALGLSPRLEMSWNQKYQRHYWRVHVSSRGMCQIGSYMRHPGKVARLRQPQQKSVYKANEVMMVLSAGDGPCVDIHVGAEDHLFWCNGLVTRNSTNFALCYGGGGNAVVRAIKNIDKNEGWRIKNQFDGTYPGLKAWWRSQHAFAHKNGFVLTPFGRIYPLPDIWSADGGFRSKAERNAVNGPVQGGGADIIKIAMALIYKECQKRGWLDRCRMIATMHDELVFEIETEILFEAIDMIREVMCNNAFIQQKRWPVPLTTDVEIGPDWMVSWDLNGMLYAENRFIGDKKVKPPHPPKQKDYDHPAAYEAALKTYNDFPGETFEEKMANWEAIPHCFPETLRKVGAPEPIRRVKAEKAPSTPLITISMPLTEDLCEQIADALHQSAGDKEVIIQTPQAIRLFQGKADFDKLKQELATRGVE